MKRAMVIVAIGVCALALVPLALAGAHKGSLVSTYGGNAGSVLSAVSKPKGGGLPYTGIDVALVIAGGLALASFGFGLRRFGRSKA